MQLELWVLFRLTAAAILGGIVGYERQSSGKEAGLRTHMLVSLGAALFASFNDLAHEDLLAQHGDLPDGLRIQVQPLSTVQAVATGVGFLGAGTIFVGGRKRVHGLTTAASIWAVSAVGLAVGFDRFLIASGGTVLMLIVLRVLAKFEPASPKRAASNSASATEKGPEDEDAGNNG